MSKQNPIAVSEQEGKYISMVGDTYRIIISGEETNNEFAVIDMLVPPGGGPNPHAHAGFHESFYVVDGEIEVKSEAGTYIAKKGAFVTIPKGGVVHMFKNKTNALAHLLCTVSPAGLEKFFEEVGKPVEAGKFLPPPEMTDDVKAQLEKTAKKFGQELYPPDYLDKK